ncbi:MAG: cell division protein SepF [Firmicutes bacterium]|nr:cell division protein SepF [Bacillota bacterium]MBR3053745.1 cell division protein SepF [Bacillota bacterium]
MGFKNSFLKIVGVDDIEDDEIVTDDELEKAMEKEAKHFDRAERHSPKPTYEPENKPESKPAFFSQPSSSAPLSQRALDKRFSVKDSGSLKLILIEPKCFDECAKLVDSLKARKPVIINLERLETEIARKIYDFLSGATYALDGNVQKIANNIFIFTPENVSVAAQQQPQEPVTAPEPETDKNPWR